MFRGSVRYTDHLRQDVQPLHESDKAALRAELVPAMTTLSDSSDKSVRIQVAEAVSQIAELDFPAKWPDLIDVRSFSFNHQTHIFLL